MVEYSEYVMNAGPPRLRLARPRKVTNDLSDPGIWGGLRAITPLWLADGGEPAPQPTIVRVCADERAAYVRFECEDRDIWGTYTRRDDPIYNEEVVEVFIAPGSEDPIHYFEFQVSPNGVLFDGKAYNPTSTRDNLMVDEKWLCPEIRWAASRDDAGGQWWGALAIPWIGITTDGVMPGTCRANFYRIERPHDGAVEYSCWSPTMTQPADFHKPKYFGVLDIT